VLYAQVAFELIQNRIVLYRPMPSTHEILILRGCDEAAELLHHDAFSNLELDLNGRVVLDGFNIGPNAELHPVTIPTDLFEIGLIIEGIKIKAADKISLSGGRPGETVQLHIRHQGVFDLMVLVAGYLVL